MIYSKQTDIVLANKSQNFKKCDRAHKNEMIFSNLCCNNLHFRFASKIKMLIKYFKCAKPHRKFYNIYTE